MSDYPDLDALDGPAAAPAAASKYSDLDAIDTAVAPKSTKTYEPHDAGESSTGLVRSFVNGSLHQIASGYVGIYHGVKALTEGKRGQDVVDAAAKGVRDYQEANQPAANTPESYWNAKLASDQNPLNLIPKAATAAGNATLDVTGSPAVATGVETAINFAPQILGAKALRGPVRGPKLTPSGAPAVEPPPVVEAAKPAGTEAAIEAHINPAAPVEPEIVGSPRAAYYEPPDDRPGAAPKFATEAPTATTSASDRASALPAEDRPGVAPSSPRMALRKPRKPPLRVTPWTAPTSMQAKVLTTRSVEP